MKCQHTFKHVDVSESLQTYAEDKLARLEKYLLKETQVHFFYSKGKHHDCCVDVVVFNGTGRFKASAHSDDFYASVDRCAQKLGKQFQKHKEKVQHHKDWGRSREASFESLNDRLEYVPTYPGKKPA